MPTRFPVYVCLALVLSAPVSVAQTKKDKDAPKFDGRLIVEDSAGLFGHEAVKKAKGILGDVRDRHPWEMQVLSLRNLNEAQQKEFDKLTDESAKERFFTELAREEAKWSKARGVFVLICHKPTHIKVLCDRETKDKGFSATDEQRVREVLTEKFRESAKAEKEDEKQALRDKGLLNAAELVRDAYKKMVR